MKWARAANEGASARVVAEFKASMEFTLQLKNDFEEIESELMSASAQIYLEEKKHPYLEMDLPAYNLHREFKFFVPSVFLWAKARGKTVPEWDPKPTSSEDSIAARASFPSTPQMGDMPRLEMVDSGNRPNRTSPSIKGVQITVHIFARALASMIDQLAEQELIKCPGDELLLNGDDSINPEALSQYIATALNLSPGSEQNSPHAESDQVTVSSKVTALTLAAVALAFATLADRARQENWIRFRNNHGEKDDRAFKSSSNIFVSNRLYDYLAQCRLIPTTPSNQDKSGMKNPTKHISGQSNSSIQHRLDAVKKYIQSDASPAISQVQLYRSLVNAMETYQSAISKSR